MRATGRAVGTKMNPMCLSDRLMIDWHVRWISKSERRLRLLMERHDCPCQLWVPKGLVQVLRGDEIVEREIDLLKTYVLLGRPGDWSGYWPCQHCVDLSLHPLEVDRYRQPLTEAEVKGLRALEAEQSAPRRFRVGSFISITQGPFSGFRGRVLGMANAKMVKVEILIFQRWTTTEVPTIAIER